LFAPKLYRIRDGNPSSIVEDDADLRGMFRTALALEGFEVVEAAGGFEALRHIDDLRPHLIVLDLGLPGISGADVRRELAASVHGRKIPIVVVTASIVIPADLHVECVLRKPVLPDELVETVRKCLATGT
jgi:DNA-binding response OmpR family regulator